MTQVLINFDFPDEYVDALAKEYPGLAFVKSTNDKEMFSYLPDTEVLVTFFKCGREIIKAAPRLKWIQVLTAGVDFMPLDTIFKRGIVLTSGNGIHRINMAEYAMASMICLARSFHLMFRNQARRKWDRTPPQDEICGATAGILGVGEIGEEIAKKASMFGMRVLGVKRNPEPVKCVDEVYGPQDMAKVFEKSDYVINLLPATPATHRIINAEYFGLMAPEACFINIGRGQTVNEEDLIEALREKKIRAMVSDVFHTEPLPEDSPLWDMENVIITPHICGPSPNYMKRAMEIIEHNMEVWVTGRGEMINVVDLEAGY